MKLDERETHAGIYRLYQDLIVLRLQDPVFAESSRERSFALPAGANALVLHRWNEKRHRLITANFGSEIEVNSADLEQFSDLESHFWTLLSTADKNYGGDDSPTSIEKGDDDLRITVPAGTASVIALEAVG